jgi:hypothetical protein
MTHTLTPNDMDRVNAINGQIPGWSGLAHYAFFKAVLSDLPWISELLVVGVYQGRDIAYILDVAKRYHPSRKLRIVGVDKFSDTPCADWPEDKRPLGWQAAGFGQAPSRARAVENLTPHKWETVALELIEANDADFLATTKDRFDFIYLDTAHDEATVTRQLQQVSRVASQHALIAGDDYSDAGTWGVKKAVGNSLSRHEVFADWIWFADRKDLKPSLTAA